MTPNEIVILNKIPEYIKLKNWEHNKHLMKCPVCQHEQLSAQVIPNTYKIKCYNCNKKYTLITFVRKLEPEKAEATQEEILVYLKDLLKVNVLTTSEEDKVNLHFELFEKESFSLLPVQRNGKRPIETGWTSTEHKVKAEWLEWLKTGLNVGVRTGMVSNVTVLDIDTKEIPEELKQYLGKTLTQVTTKGYHLFFKYEKDLPKTRIDELKLDIENDGGQVVVYPSKVEDKERTFFAIQPVETMPLELKTYITAKLPTMIVKTFSEKMKEEIDTENFKINMENLKLKSEGLQGCCNVEFAKLGGVLRKNLSLPQVEYTLRVINRLMLDQPMAERDISSMVRQLDKYASYDEKELSYEVIKYLKDTEYADRTDITKAMGEPAKRIANVLNYLVREGYILKRGRNYCAVKKLDWQTALVNIGKPVGFKVPYFDDVAKFNYGDLIVIGASSGVGKTHVAMNMVKRFVDQGIKPYYISRETGSRFAKIALQLGLQEGDFGHKFCGDPTKIEFEKGAVTIIDWLLPQDYAKTDQIFDYFSQLLEKTQGFLIVFVQLRKETNEWYAKDQIEFFPALTTKYAYDNVADGSRGSFEICKIREGVQAKKHVVKIPCRYDWDTKQLIRIDEEENGKV
jgi:hypothetical protein